MFLAKSTSSLLAKAAMKVRPSSVVPAARFINLHEYQSKDLMDKFGINIQKWRVADTPEGIVKGAKELNTSELVLKAQVHAGGRGKGTFDNGFKGGVQFPKTPEEAGEMAKQMLGFNLKTHQTPPEGVLVRKLTIAQGLDISRETYFAILYDRAFQGPVMMGSAAGGVEIEEVAAKTPELIHTEPIDIMKGVQPEQTARMAKELGFKGDLIPKAQEQMKRLYDLFLNVDATQVEINPFGETPDGQVVCFDAKINFDDFAMYRQKEIYDQRDESEEDPREVQAKQYGLNYVGLTGNIGCMVNGAGLAMGTMDIIKLHGGEPANFLDVGGGANEEQVAEAFKILTQDSNVQAILVNIFGGIMKCDVIARGIINAVKTVDLKVPLVVRLEGTNVESGKDLLRNSGLTIIAAEDLNDAAEKAVATLKA
eukprot:GCRY01000388.1.p1 GENE.GCRY01000388.1~~GCRY01000388.1.p1  ORF type:complete len:455 (+),score=96.17 GCRY01000388.1:96-1367(+)